MRRRDISDGDAEGIELDHGTAEVYPMSRSGHGLRTGVMEVLVEFIPKPGPSECV